MKSKPKEPNRDEYRCEKGVAAWWPKDGAWHIALPGTNCFGKPDVLWTAEQYPSREAAIEALS